MEGCVEVMMTVEGGGEKDRQRLAVAEARGTGGWPYADKSADCGNDRMDPKSKGNPGTDKSNKDGEAV